MLDRDAECSPSASIELPISPAQERACRAHAASADTGLTRPGLRQDRQYLPATEFLPITAVGATEAKLRIRQAAFPGLGEVESRPAGEGGEAALQQSRDAP